MWQIFSQLVVAVIFLIPQSGNTGLSPSDFSGEWKSGNLSGVVTTGQNKECKSIASLERTLTLERVPGKPDKMRGEWNRVTTYMWISSNGRRCRWGSEDSFAQTLSALTLYSIDGSLDPNTGRLVIDGTYEKCNGDGCAIWVNAEAKKPFHTELVYTAGAIVDSDPAAKSQTKFIRTSEASERTEAARLAADHALSFIDKGDYDRFFQETWVDASVTPAVQESMKAGFASARDNRGEVVSRLPAYEMYAESWANSPNVGDYALVIRDVKTSKNVTAREVVMMGMQSGSWRVMWFYYLS
jgi:hypothetical protein